MCPACYINAILFSIFGASAASISNNPWVITLSIVLTILALYWLYKGWASYTTHEYFKNMFEEEHKH